MPYVALGPGPTYDTLGEVDGTPLLEIEGRPTFPTEGHLDLTTVGVRPRLTLVEAIAGWFDRDRAVVPREVVYPPGQDRRRRSTRRTPQADDDLAGQRHRRRRRASSGSGTADVLVDEVADGSPADGRLRGGRPATVDGRPLRDAADLRALSSAGRGRATSSRIGYERDGEADDGRRCRTRGVGRRRRAAAGRSAW